MDKANDGSEIAFEIFDLVCLALEFGCGSRLNEA